MFFFFMYVTVSQVMCVERCHGDAVDAQTLSWPLAGIYLYTHCEQALSQRLYTMRTNSRSSQGSFLLE